MDPLLELHNSHWESPEIFGDKDMHLRRLKKRPYIYNPPLLSMLPRDIPGIYNIGGGDKLVRQHS